eukprot:1624334-Rhodomonas_salina.2
MPVRHALLSVRSVGSASRFVMSQVQCSQSRTSTAWVAAMPCVVLACMCDISAVMRPASDTIERLDMNWSGMKCARALDMNRG